jgi:hypothetical protein
MIATMDLLHIARSGILEPTADFSSELEIFNRQFDFTPCPEL